MEWFILTFHVFEILCPRIDEPVSNLLKLEMNVSVSETPLGIGEESLPCYLTPGDLVTARDCMTGVTGDGRSSSCESVLWGQAENTDVTRFPRGPGPQAANVAPCDGVLF